MLRLIYNEKLSPKTIAAKWDQPVSEVTKQSRNALRSLYNSDFSNILLYGIHSTDKSAYEKAYNEGYDKGYIDGYKDGRNDLKKDKDFKTRQENSVIKELKALLVISLVKQRVKFSNGERISLSLLIVPAMANIILALIIFLVPYLNVTTTPSLSSKMIEILESNFPFAVDIIMFFISLFVHHLHREKDNKFIK